MTPYRQAVDGHAGYFPIEGAMSTVLHEARPIRLDDAMIDALVASLVSQVEDALTARLLSVPSAPLGEIRLGEKRVSVTDVRGTKRDLFVKVKTRLARAPKLGLGGKYEPQKNKVVIYLNGIYPADVAIGMLRGSSMETFEGAIRSVLVHELTHASDNLKMKGYKSPIAPDASTDAERLQAYIDYINQPEELRAFMQQLVREALNNARTLSSYKTLTSQQARLRVLLNASPTHAEIGKYLTPINRKKVLQAVYDAVGEYLKTGAKPQIPGAPTLRPPPKGVAAPETVKVSSHIKSRFADLELEWADVAPRGRRLWGSTT